MASSAVALKGSRVGTWNVQFLDHNYDVFAGVYQRDDFVSYRDVFAELHLTFDFQDGPHDPIPLSLWPYRTSPNITSAVYEEEAGRDSLPAPEERNPPSQFLIAHHTLSDCSHQDDEDIDVHVKASRQFYQPINKRLSDPTISSFPFRRRSASPRKRSHSESEPPSKDGVGNDDASIAPSSIESGLARMRMASFRDLTILRHDHCAITGVGRPWHGGSVRPGIHACHIVPQIHYHVYPLSMDDLEPATPIIQSSRRMLEEQWNLTWSPDNGICLASHMHELYDSRLISIHPKTFKIRVFAPYDMMLPYHGKTAHFGSIAPSKRSLEHHWRVTCIENMGANYLESLSPPSSLPPSSSLMELAMRPPIQEGDYDEEVAPKRSQQDNSGSISNTGNKRRAAATDAIDLCTPGLTDGGSVGNEDDQRSVKRPRPNDDEVLDMLDGSFDKFVSESNHRDFLADVNWELGRWAH